MNRMDDLISRQAVIDVLDGICNRECEYSKKQRAYMCGSCHLGSAFDAIEELPSAERKTGRWVDGRVAFFLTCSKCGCHVRKNISEVFEGKGALNYCPNCGAKMGVEND